MPPDSPSFLVFQDADLTALTELGVKIAAATYLRSDGTLSIRLRGICQWGGADRQEFPEIVLRAAHVVLVFGKDHIPYSYPVVGESILFDDDNHKSAGVTRGYFDIDLFAQGKLVPQRGTFFISVAFATQVSNVVSVTI